MPTARAIRINPTEPLSMETTCVTIAKGRQRMRDILEGKTSWVHGQTWKGGAHALQEEMRRDFKSHLCNGLVRFSAGEGQTDKAERWMTKLDHHRGLEPEIRTFNALLQGLVDKGDLEKADIWFGKPFAAALHPELGPMRPSSASYDIMVQAAAQAGDLVRAERYLFACLDRGFRPHRNSFISVVRCLIGAQQPKRAHSWMEEYVERGCSSHSSYRPEAVKQTMSCLRSLRKYDPEEHFCLVRDLAANLAGSGNTVSANRWLGYLVECGVRPDDAMETWDYVRSFSPRRIMPASLHCEITEPDMLATASVQVPALLHGEREQALEERARHRYALAVTPVRTASPEGLPPARPRSVSPTEKRKTPDGRISQASTRLGSSSARSTPVTRGSPTPPPSNVGELAPRTGLQRLIGVKKRGEKVANTCAARRLSSNVGQGPAAAAQGRAEQRLP